ncbi:MAG: hypothetical protein ACXWR0_12630 [Bdellovibrio sp.]
MSSSSAFSSELPWLVKVQSEYKDVRHPERKKQAIVGAGVLAKIASHYFVLSVSHLSQGENLKLSLPFQKINLVPKGDAYRLTMSEADTELIEIEKPSIDDKKIFNWNYYSEFFELDEPYESFKKDNKNYYIQASENYLAVRPPWLRDSAIAYDQLKKINLQQLIFWTPVSVYLDWYNLQVVSDSWIVHGMSGAPLISGLKKDSKVVPAIFGLSRSFHRHFPKSYFAGPALIKMIENFYEQGKRGAISKISWKYTTGVGLFRFYQNEGISEINSEEIPTGGGDGAEGGGGDSAEGGGGDSVEGGKTGSKNLSFSSQTYSALGLHAGMRSQTDSILAFKFAKASWGPSFSSSTENISVYADSWGMDYKRILDSYNGELEWTTVNTKTALFPLFLEKVNSAGHYMNELPRMDLCIIDDSDFSDEVIKVSLRQFNGSSSRLINFELNSYGVISSTNGRDFVPIISVGSPSIVVDIKGLFFFSPADIRPTRNNAISSLSFLFAGVPYVSYRVNEDGPAYPVFCNIGKTP